MISFATIGTSWITDSFIASAHLTEQWQLTAVYSRTDSKGRDFALKYDNKNVRVHTTIAALVSDNVDAVYIASPNSLHFEHAKACIEAGKHVIVEKPAACNSREFDELCGLSRKHDVFFLEAFRHVHEANFDLLRQALPRLGSIYGALFTYASYSSRYNNVLAGETPNIFSLEFAGGSLVDLGVYPISAAVALFGKPDSQSYAPVTIRTGADGGGVVVLKYDGFAVQINASKIYTSTCPSEVYGEKGTLSFSDFNAIQRITFTDAKTKKTEQLSTKKADSNMVEEAAEFARIIRNNDHDAASRLVQLSRTVLIITEDLRKANGLLYPSDDRG